MKIISKGDPQNTSILGAGSPDRTVFVGSDHAATAAKSLVIDVVSRAGGKVVDCGPQSTESVDYPDFADEVCRGVCEQPGSFGILLCGTGIGMSMAANKWPGIRAALAHDVTTARMSRLHNDANVLVIGGGILGPRLIEEMVDAWLTTPFEGGRHQRRIDKIHAIETREATKE